MLLSILNFAAETYGWKLDYILDSVSILSIMLLMRQKLAVDGHFGIFLEDKEMLDNNNWDELLKRNKQGGYM